MKIKIILIILIIFINGCSPLPVNIVDGENTVIIGQQLNIQLESSCKSQTKWIITDYNQELLQLVSKNIGEWQDPHSGSKCYSSFTFRALKAGDTTINFKLEKIWGTGNLGTAVRNIKIKYP